MTIAFKALIVDTPYIDLILEGKKTWDLRSSHSSIRGRIALIRKGSGTIVGAIDIVDSIGPLSHQELVANSGKHHLREEDLKDPKMAKWRYAWVLKNGRKLAAPIPYRHPQGAVIWVNLNSELNLDSLEI